ncbi:hypothetical protein [Sulfobacillus harzensis]|uniref:Uncharacterized protein n=1 Tax=Sulfobacillus harzensis TaxID=2729629 RepID=A0A7Y0Q0Y6_9FIRM|nr:hypothetical protein [Sulfobacillus harzensis]NMP20750.1 hypothetical protein [Sulfobacillus harzensis]
MNATRYTRQGEHEVNPVYNTPEGTPPMSKPELLEAAKDAVLFDVTKTDAFKALPASPFPAIQSLGIFCPLCGHDQWIRVPIPALVQYAVCVCEGTQAEPQYTAQAAIMGHGRQGAWHLVPAGTHVVVEEA